MGTQDVTDIPTDYDVRRAMPLPWLCPHCGHGHMMYAFACVRCGTLSPLGRTNWRA